MDFNLTVQDLIKERDEIGRAYRQTLNTVRKPQQDTPQQGNVKDVYNTYKQASQRAKRILNTRKGQPIPIIHIIQPFNTYNKKITLQAALQYIFSKADKEISVSLFRSWYDSDLEEGENNSCIILKGTTTDIHEWYPTDAGTSSSQEKEKTSDFAYRYNTYNQRRVSGTEPDGRFDEGIVNLQDVRWDSYKIVYGTDIQGNRSYNVNIKNELGVAERFLNARNLKKVN